MWRGICKESRVTPCSLSPSCAGLGRTCPEKGTFHVSCVARPLSLQCYENALCYLCLQCYRNATTVLFSFFSLYLPLSMCTCYSQCSVLDIIVCVTQKTEWCVAKSKLQRGVVIPSYCYYIY